MSITFVVPVPTGPRTLLITYESLKFSPHPFEKVNRVVLLTALDFNLFFPHPSTLFIVGHNRESQVLRDAIIHVLGVQRIRTRDLGGESSTHAVVQAIIKRIGGH